MGQYLEGQCGLSQSTHTPYLPRSAPLFPMIHSLNLPDA